MCSAFWADGSAMFTTVASSTTMSWASAMTASASHRRLSGGLVLSRPPVVVAGAATVSCDMSPPIAGVVRRRVGACQHGACAPLIWYWSLVRSPLAGARPAVDNGLGNILDDGYDRNP